MKPNWDDETDVISARRGLIDKLDPCVIRSPAGRVVWDNERWGFLRERDCPPSVHPSLWRVSGLNAEQGLFEVVPGVYQLRGLDVSNMTVIEGKVGVVIIDPLTSTECAAAGWELYRRNRGERPVLAVVYTHSHVDHFGGAGGIVTGEAVAAGDCAIVAPDGFMHHAVGENVIAGPAMARRAEFMFGRSLPAGPDALVGTGIGQAFSAGTAGLIPPTVTITETGQELAFDGVRLVFQLTPDTEAPAEMNVYLPDRRVLLIAENVSHTLHNVLTLRGALVRDPQAWAGYITEGIALFADAEVLIGSHHWPTWGNAAVRQLLTEQRDAYAYIHDQTVRLMNRGLTGTEIAEELAGFPGELGRRWSVRGYYGSVSHNVKAVYQRYMGWYDGNPAHLWQLPPAEAATRYVELMGGAVAVLARARESFDRGDLRWAAELLNHVLFADPGHAQARELQARTFERLGRAQENATWRNIYLSGAAELRGSGEEAGAPAAGRGHGIGMLHGLTTMQLFQALAVRLDGPRAASHRLLIRWELPDVAETWTVLVGNGVLTPMPGDAPGGEGPQLTVTLDRAVLNRVVAGHTTFGAAAGEGSAKLAGDPSVLTTLLGLLEAPVPRFHLALP